MNILKPWQFLTLIFRYEARTRKRPAITLDELNDIKDYLKSRYDVEVDWDHDSANMLWGFYAPVFKVTTLNKNRAVADAVRCNYTILRTMGKWIWANGSYVPKPNTLSLATMREWLRDQGLMDDNPDAKAIEDTDAKFASATTNDPDQVVRDIADKLHLELIDARTVLNGMNETVDSIRTEFVGSAFSPWLKEQITVKLRAGWLNTVGMTSVRDIHLHVLWFTGNLIVLKVSRMIANLRRVARLMKITCFTGGPF